MRPGTTHSFLGMPPLTAHHFHLKMLYDESIKKLIHWLHQRTKDPDTSLKPVSCQLISQHMSLSVQVGTLHIQIITRDNFKNLCILELKLELFTKFSCKGLYCIYFQLCETYDIYFHSLTQFLCQSNQRHYISELVWWFFNETLFRKTKK